MKNDFFQREIVLTSVPFTDNIRFKVRPVLIISNNKYNKYSSDYLVINISSTANDNYYNLDILTSDLENGKLKLESKAKCDKIGSLEKENIKQKIATVSPAFFKRVKERIHALIN